jgi:hypothetical protein
MEGLQLCASSVDILQFIRNGIRHRVSVFTYICFVLFLQEVDTLLITNFGELESVMGSVLQSKYVIRGFLSLSVGFQFTELPSSCGMGSSIRRIHSLSGPYH